MDVNKNIWNFNLNRYLTSVVLVYQKVQKRLVGDGSRKCSMKKRGAGKVGG